MARCEWRSGHWARRRIDDQLASGIEARRAETRNAARSRSDESPARVSARRPNHSSLAWRDNMPAFDGETLNEAIAQVSQQTSWEFELADPALGNERVGGYVQADPEAFIELMSSSLDLEARREGDRRVILARRR